MNDNSNLKPKRSMGPIAIAILLILILVIGWHLILPLLGLTIAFTATVWGIFVATVVILCIAIILFFILTGVGVFILGLIAFVWAIIAIGLFPFLFPIIAPIVIIMLLIAYMIGRRRNR